MLWDQRSLKQFPLTFQIWTRGFTLQSVGSIKPNKYSVKLYSRSVLLPLSLQSLCVGSFLLTFISASSIQR